MLTWRPKLAAWILSAPTELHRRPTSPPPGGGAETLFLCSSLLSRLFLQTATPQPGQSPDHLRRHDSLQHGGGHQRQAGADGVTDELSVHGRARILRLTHGLYKKHALTRRGAICSVQSESFIPFQSSVCCFFFCWCFLSHHFVYYLYLLKIGIKYVYFKLSFLCFFIFIPVITFIHKSFFTVCRLSNSSALMHTCIKHQDVITEIFIILPLFHRLIHL